MRRYSLEEEKRTQLVSGQRRFRNGLQKTTSYFFASLYRNSTILPFAGVLFRAWRMKMPSRIDPPAEATQSLTDVRHARLHSPKDGRASRATRKPAAIWAASFAEASFPRGPWPRRTGPISPQQPPTLFPAAFVGRDRQSPLPSRQRRRYATGVMAVIRSLTD